MMLNCKLSYILVAVIVASEASKFPDDFLFGVAASAYQIEGAWNVDGKGPSIWDEYTHSHPEKIAGRQNGDVATNSYEYFLDDINAIKNVNMSFYRFSIAWSRVLPNGDMSNINEKGIEYYDKIINKLLELNIQPMITMFHWDLPLQLQKLGGFANPNLVDYFTAYANLLFERFGDRVKYWITFNEPNIFCTLGYGGDLHAPALNYSGVADLLCGHNVLKSHAVVYHLYKEYFHDRFKGQLGLALQSFFFYSAKGDSEIVDRAMQFMLGWFAHPIFSSEGNFPDVMIEKIGNNSKLDGLSNSRLPTFSKQWIDKIRGTADFFGLNYYTSTYIEPTIHQRESDPFLLRSSNLKQVKMVERKCGSLWLCSVPEGFGDILRWVKKQYNNPEVFVLENGWTDSGGLEDHDRIEYLHDHLHVMQDVISNNECNVKAYTVWSVIDNFEWTSGYTEHFGLYSVNMTSPRRERTPKMSANYMKMVTTSYQIPKIK